jgi:phospholipid-binding lipoprotein MlaA
MVSSSSTVRIFVLTLLFLAILLPAGGSGRLSLEGFTLSNMAIAVTETTILENGEEFEPFAEPVKDEYASDPLERFNRIMFQFNDKLYFWCLKPVSKIYSAFIPTGLRAGVRNGFDNLRFPCRFVNNVLQGKFKAAGVETGRFLINSTLGLVGFVEVAGRDFDLPSPVDEDTGQTLAFYGLKSGWYIVWPVLGPSTIRDSFGLAGDTFLNPIYYLSYFSSVDLWESAGMRAGIILNNTSLRIGEYEDFKKAALDPYVSMRQAYLQHRQNEILK